MGHGAHAMDPGSPKGCPNGVQKGSKKGSNLRPQEGGIQGPHQISGSEGPNPGAQDP